MTRLILDTHDARGFAIINHLTVGDFSRTGCSTTPPMKRRCARVARAITRDGRRGQQADAHRI